MHKRVFRSFKLCGLGLQADAAKSLCSVLLREDDFEQALHAIIDAIKTRIERGELTSSVVDHRIIESVVAELSKDERDLSQESLQVFDSFTLPHLKYNAVRKKFYLQDAQPAKLHANAGTKALMFRERLVMIHQRVMRNPVFSPPLLSSSKKDFVELTPIESLLGARGTKRLLGMITSRQEGEFYLEDLNGSIKLDLSQAQITAGLFTENCIVLAEGEVLDQIFAVHMMGFPPPETRQQTTQVMLHMDRFGTNYTQAHLCQLKEMEQAATDAMFVILSDVHLDRPQVFEKLRTLLEGFEDIGPQLFVFMGDFCSQPLGHHAEDIVQYRRRMDQLCSLILEFPRLCNESHFIFIPGPNDPGSGNILPRPGLPRFFTQKLRDRIPHAAFPSNPCRIRYFAQEIVLFREDLLHTMRRHCLIAPACNSISVGPEQDEDGMDAAAAMEGGATELEGTDEMEITEHLVKTLLDQAHLCPLPLTARPLYWGYDHAMSLHPLPDLLVLADKADQYQWKYEDCSVFNPGTFPADFSFVVYRPATLETEFSRID